MRVSRLRQTQILLFSLLTAAIFASCATTQSAGSNRSVDGWQAGLVLEGEASWYGGKFHGRKTANGEIFDMNKLTGAHKTMPLGSLVRVTNLANGESIEVRINDRGPYVEGRMLDLSKEAARQLGYLSKGKAQVRVEIIEVGDGKYGAPPSGGSATESPTIRSAKSASSTTSLDCTAQACVIIGRYKKKWKAQRMLDFLAGRFSTLRMEKVNGRFLLIVGPFESESAKRDTLQMLKDEGYDARLN